MDVDEFPPNVRHTGGFRDALLVQPGIASVTIRLEDTFESGEMGFRMFAFAIRAVAIQHRLRSLASERMVVTDIAPDLSGSGLAVSGCQHRDRGVIGVNSFPRHHVYADRIDQRT
jgi:hypothetical protein